MFFQHVGEKGGSRDFPRTIGTQKDGLKYLHFAELIPHLKNLTANELEQLKRDTSERAPDGFQVWGIPSGAKAILRDFQNGDYLLLLEAVGPGGSFAYAGRAIAMPPKECFDLSMNLWGEQRFPLIVFLKGALTSYRWFDFCENLGYKTNWNPAGQTYRIQYDRLVRSPYVDENGLVRAIAGQLINFGPSSSPSEVPFLDEAELDYKDEEGRRVLRLHLQRERSSSLVRNFKRNLTDYSCRICGFNFLEVYGEVGRDFIEAHHSKPVSELKEAESVHISDLIAVCSNCHGMLHRSYPAINWRELRELMEQAFASRR